MTEQKDKSVDLAPVPEHIEEEAGIAKDARLSILQELSLRGKGAVDTFLQTTQYALDVIQKTVIRESHPYSWTKYRDREGKVVCVPRDQACVEMRKWLGISITNYNPKNQDNTVDPKVSKDPDTGATVVELWADGKSSITKEKVEQIYYAARSDDDFVGRRNRIQDLKAACRTGLDSKITRILCGLRKVPEELLQKEGLNTEQCYKGHGYGTSTERTASSVAEPGVKEKAKEFGREILSRTNGDKAAAKELLLELTKSADGKFPGFDSVSRMTKLWQVDNAVKKLQEHPVFGDNPEPGATDDVNGQAKIPY